MGYGIASNYYALLMCIFTNKIPEYCINYFGLKSQPHLLGKAPGSPKYTIEQLQEFTRYKEENNLSWTKVVDRLNLDINSRTLEQRVRKARKEGLIK